MKKKKLIILFFNLLIICNVFFNVVLADDPYNGLGDGFNYENVPSTNQEEILGNPIRRISGTVTYILQVLSVIAVIYTGVRYMFAGADKKADMKKSTIYIIFGLILVFAFTTFINFVIDIQQQVTAP